MWTTKFKGTTILRTIRTGTPTTGLILGDRREKYHFGIRISSAVHIRFLEVDSAIWRGGLTLGSVGVIRENALAEPHYIHHTDDTWCPDWELDIMEPMVRRWMDVPWPQGPLRDDLLRSGLSSHHIRDQSYYSQPHDAWFTPRRHLQIRFAGIRVDTSICYPNVESAISYPILSNWGDDTYPIALAYARRMGLDLDAAYAAVFRSIQIELNRVDKLADYDPERALARKRWEYSLTAS